MIFVASHRSFSLISLRSNDITTLIEDRQGGIWIGTAESGINYWNPNLHSFSFHPLICEGEPETAMVTSFVEREDGSLIIAGGAWLYSWNPEKNQYEYRLLGYQEEWIRTDAKNRIATYTNLPPGDYTFQVKGSKIEVPGRGYTWYVIK